MSGRSVLVISVVLFATLSGSRAQAGEVLITGKVVDENGVPLVDVYLNAFDPADGDSTATTRSDGSFALATGSASVHLSFFRNGLWLYYIGQPTLSKKWTQAQTIRLAGSSIELAELTFATNAYTVAGVVVNSDGVPVPGVELYADRDNLGQSSDPATSDHDGRFSLHNLLPGDHRIIISWGAHMLYFRKDQEATPHVWDASSITITDYHVSGITVTLPPLRATTPLSGQLRWQSGTPVDGISEGLGIKWSRVDDGQVVVSGNATVSEAGLYEFELEPGSYTLELESYDAGNLSFEGYSAANANNLSPLRSEHSVIAVGDTPVMLPPVILPALPRIDVWAEGEPGRVTEIGLCYELDILLCKAIGNVDLSSRQTFIVPRHAFYLYFTVDGLTRFWNPQRGDPLRRLYSDRGRLSVPEGTVMEVVVTPPPPSRSAVFSLQLEAGWNTIGWYGGATSTHEFCRASDHANFVAVLNPGTGAFRLSWCSQILSDTTDHEVATGAVLVLRASREARLEVPAMPLDQHIAVPAGRSLLVWLGEDGVSLDVVKQGLGAAVVGLRHRSVYTHRPANEETVQKGDLLEVDARHAFDWLAPVEPKAPDAAAAGSKPAADEATLVDRLSKAQEFFGKVHGVVATDFEVNYLACAEGADCVSSASSNGKAITLYVLDLGTVAHEYYHVLQGQLSDNNEPTGGSNGWVKPHWLVEGAATFAAYAAEQESTEIRDEPVVPRSHLNDSAWRKFRLCDLTGDVYGSELNVASYLLGALAVEYLARVHGDLNRVLDFWRVADYASDLSEAFRIAFDLEFDVFCDSFEEYRAHELGYSPQ